MAPGSGSLRRPSMGPMAADGDGCAWGDGKADFERCCH